MHFSWFDLILLITAFGFVWGGFWTGLIQSIGGVVGLFVGSMVASRYYSQVAGFLQPVFGGNVLVSQIFAFLFLFLFVTRLVGVVFWLVNKVFNLFAIVPGMKFVNKIGGAVFGLLEASLFIGISLQFIVRLPISNNFATMINDSGVAKYFLQISGWLVPLFPKILKDSQNAVDHLLPKNVNVNINVNSTLNTINTIKNTGLVK